MSPLSLGIVGSSNKENEDRLAIYPAQIAGIDPDLRKRIYLESGYGEKFGTSARKLDKLVAGILPREALFETCDMILLPKPTNEDLPLFREGQIVWGWPHCVQGELLTQTAINKKMTILAWEEMFLWKDKIRDLHIFHKNNEMAGYCSVLHAMQLSGTSGHYGTHKRAAVISFGSTGRGAVHALKGMGVSDITVFTQRRASAINAPIPSLKYQEYRRVTPGDNRVVAVQDDNNSTIPFALELGKYDIIVNCILQNTDSPIQYVQGDEIEHFRSGNLIIDVSCDIGMGFDFARPTSFEKPTFSVGNACNYYAVDHSPTYLWNAATYEISNALLPYLETVMGGEDAWKRDTTISKCIEISNGVILNPKILRFQNRTAEYPHTKIL